MEPAGGQDSGGQDSEDELLVESFVMDISPAAAFVCVCPAGIVYLAIDPDRAPKAAAPPENRQGTTNNGPSAAVATVMRHLAAQDYLNGTVKKRRMVVACFLTIDFLYFLGLLINSLVKKSRNEYDPPGALIDNSGGIPWAVWIPTDLRLEINVFTLVIDFVGFIGCLHKRTPPISMFFILQLLDTVVLSLRAVSLFILWRLGQLFLVSWLRASIHTYQVMEPGNNEDQEDIYLSGREVLGIATGFFGVLLGRDASEGAEERRARRRARERARRQQQQQGEQGAGRDVELGARGGGGQQGAPGSGRPQQGGSTLTAIMSLPTMLNPFPARLASHAARQARSAASAPAAGSAAAGAPGMPPGLMMGPSAGFVQSNPMYAAGASSFPAPAGSAPLAAVTPQVWGGGAGAAGAGDASAQVRWVPLALSGMSTPRQTRVGRALTGGVQTNTASRATAGGAGGVALGTPVLGQPAGGSTRPAVVLPAGGAPGAGGAAGALSPSSVNAASSTLLFQAALMAALRDMRELRDRRRGRSPSKATTAQDAGQGGGAGPALQGAGGAAAAGSGRGLQGSAAPGASEAAGSSLEGASAGSGPAAATLTPAGLNPIKIRPPSHELHKQGPPSARPSPKGLHAPGSPNPQPLLPARGTPRRSAGLSRGAQHSPRMAAVCRHLATAMGGAQGPAGKAAAQAGPASTRLPAAPQQAMQQGMLLGGAAGGRSTSMAAPPAAPPAAGPATLAGANAGAVAASPAVPIALRIKAAQMLLASTADELRALKERRAQQGAACSEAAQPGSLPAGKPESRVGQAAFPPAASQQQQQGGSSAQAGGQPGQGQQQQAARAAAAAAAVTTSASDPEADAVRQAADLADLLLQQLGTGAQPAPPRT